MDEIFEMQQTSNRDYLKGRLKKYSKEDLEYMMVGVLEIFVPSKNYDNLFKRLDEILENDGNV
jgi:hypothetical protein